MTDAAAKPEQGRLSRGARIALQLAPFVAALGATLAFFPVLSNGWVGWDDPQNFLSNPYYRGFSRENLVWMFTSCHMGNYQPLSWLTLAGDYSLWGMEPKGYHLTNLLIHSANAGLLYLLCLRILAFPSQRLDASRRMAPTPFPGVGATSAPYEGALVPLGWLAVSALIGSLFWSVHPLRTESVAWITERRDVLSAFFLLLSLLFWLRWARTDERRCWALSLGAYGFSLLSKAMGMTFPVLLLILEVYPLGRLPAAFWLWHEDEHRAKLKALALFAMFAVGGMMSGVWSVLHSGFMPLERFGMLERLSRACYALLFYVGKTLWPSGLLPLYETPQYLDPWSAPYLLSMAAVAAAGVALLLWARRIPALACASLAFFVALSPVLGLVWAGSLMAADRFTYIPGLAWAVLAGAGLSAVLQRCGRSGRVLILSLCTAVLIALGGLSRKQCSYWKDSETLWRRVLALAPATAIAHHNLAVHLAEQGRFAEASRHFGQAQVLRPQSGPYRVHFRRYRDAAQMLSSPTPAVSEVPPVPAGQNSSRSAPASGPATRRSGL